MKGIKKFFLGVGCTAGVVAGFALIWNVVIPFMGKVITNFFGFLS